MVDRRLTVDALTEAARDFAAARDWEQFHDPKSLVMALASEVGELAALLRWVRDEQADAATESGARRDALAAEIGDVGICLLLLCARTKIDLGQAVLSKLELNAAKYPVEDSRGRADPPTPNVGPAAASA